MHASSAFDGACVGFRQRAAWVIAAFLVVVCVSAPLTARAEPEPFPLQPPLTSSPRATLESFLSNFQTAYDEFTNARDTGDWSALGNRYMHARSRAVDCLDLSDVPPGLRDDVEVEAAILLKEVLDRVPLPEPSAIPGKEDVEKDDITSWRIPMTDIAITKVKEGERAGEFLFDPQTVKRIKAFYERVKDLPYQSHPTITPFVYTYYIERPGDLIPPVLARMLPTSSLGYVLGEPPWKWIGVVVVLLLAVAAAALAFLWSRRIDQFWAKRRTFRRIGSLMLSITLIALPLAVSVLSSDVIGLRGSPQNILDQVMTVLTYTAAIFALFVILDIVSDWIISARGFGDKTINANLVRVLVRIVSIIGAIYLIIAATEYLGLAIAPVLAGLGVGGLAVALAARPTLENVIGGLILFADKPVRVGDFCKFGEEFGTVEEIGLRSTRLRTLADTIVSVPNADFSQIQLENKSRRKNIWLRMTLGLRYETTSDQLRYTLARLREMLLGHPKVSRDSLRVRFKEFGAYSLDLELNAYIRTKEWAEYLAIREDINLRIIDIIKEAGTGFAFPSQTAYLARDSGLSVDERERAEAEVVHWRTRHTLPFPDFDRGLGWELEDMLDYPPRGSPEYTPREGVSADDRPPVNPTSDAPLKQAAGPAEPDSTRPNGHARWLGKLKRTPRG